MAFNPSEEHIKLFVEMAPGVSRKEIIQRIKGNNNNVEQALNEYYDNPNTNKYSSDDTSSDNEQDSGSMENHGIFFKFQTVDVAQQFSQYNSAPSRPPSRINNKSPLQNTYSSTGHTTGDDLNNRHQDAELTKALVLSAQEAGLTSQDTSSSGRSGTYFCPATRELYDSNQWSMVPLGKVACTGFDADPDPLNREREPGTPAFLKPSIRNHYLAALISIYHEIPLMRNIFLNTADVLDNYGYDNQWWAGKPIELCGGLGSDEATCVDINRELQRLMAFLDDTERAYGSVEPLSNAPKVMAFSSAQDGSDKPCAFLEAWKQVFLENPQKIDQVFSAGVASEYTEQDEKNFAILELTPPNHSFYKNLYDICDECLWPELQPLELATSPYLSHIAEVITFKIETRSDHKKIEFPAIWYPDRYLKPSLEVSLEMRKKKYEVLEEIDRITQLENRLTNITSPNGNVFSVKETFEVSLKHDERFSLDDEGQDKIVTEDKTNSPSVISEKLSAELTRVIDSIDKKIDELNRKKDVLITHLHQLSTLSTQQSPSPVAPKLKPYSLRGLRTTESTMYVCQRIDDQRDFLSSQDDPSLPLDQWWRIQYSTDTTPVFALERTTTQKVLTAASEECIDPMLVYASENALSVSKEPLPKSLKKFVQWDNRLFAHELQEEKARSETNSLKAMGFGKSDYISGLPSSSPGKRKYVYGDSEDIEMGSGRLERRSSENSVFNIEGFYDESHSNVDENLEKVQAEHNLIVGIDPSFAEVNKTSRDSYH